LTCDIQAGEESPIVNPAFVIKNWGDDNARLTMDGKPVSKGKAFRYGHRRNLDGVDLIAWMKVESTKPLKLSIVRE
jgi:hypothetical protein